MKKSILISALFCSFCATLTHAGTSLLTGTLTDAQGNPLNGFLVMQLPVPAQDPTTQTAISNIPVNYRVVNGSIQGGPPLWDVGTINPANLYYSAKAYDAAGNLFFYGNYVVTGATFNLSAAIPTTITTSNVSYLNPVNVNGNNTFTGSNTFTGTTTFNGIQIFQTATIFDVSGTGCTKTLNLLNTDASPTNPNKYFRINQSTGALEFMSNACSLIASLSDAGVFTASSGFCIGASCISAWPLTLIIPNASVTGTSVNALTTLTGAPSAAVINPTNHSLGAPIGITISGAGTTGSATIQQLGQVSCVFDGATTAGDYFAASTITAGDCSDVGATPTAQSLGRVLSTNGGGGTYATILGPMQGAPPGAPQRVALSSPVALTASTQTIILTESVTFPSVPGTYRADSRYGVYITSGANPCAAEVIDTTNTKAFALSGQNSNGTGYLALSGSEVSSNTYATGATATFTLQVICTNGAGGLVGATVNSGVVTFSPAEASYLSVVPVLSQ